LTAEIESDFQKRPRVSVVVPLLNEQDSLRELAGAVKSALEPRFTYELIFVDDGSTDRSWSVIEQIKAEGFPVRAMRFRRNYGKSMALAKGFEMAGGDFVATMDADLQDDPAEFPAMIDMIETDNLDLVSGWKKIRHDPMSKTIPSRFFNWVTSRATGIGLHDFNCGLKVYRREVVQNIELYGEMHRYIPALAKWEGFEAIGEKVVTHHPRKFGKTKFGLSRFINGFLDLLTLLFINVYFQRPMHFFGSLGVGFVSAGSIITIYLVYMRIFYDQYLSNRPLLLFGALFILLGLQFFSVGFLGEMLIKSRKRKRAANIRTTI